MDSNRLSCFRFAATGQDDARHGRDFRFSRAFIGKQVAFRPTQADGIFDAYFRHQKIKTIDLNDIPK